MRVLVGIGNPGSKYEGTRHNVGFDTVDILAARYGEKLSTKKWQALSTEVLLPSCGKVLLVKPQTYVNETGKTVQALLSFYKLSIEDLCIVVDDIHLNLGDIRIRKGGGPGGHNGLKSIQQHIGKEYARMRLGIGKPEYDQVAHVLGRFTVDQQVDANALFYKAADCAEAWLCGEDVPTVAGRFNGPLRPPPPRVKKEKAVEEKTVADETESLA